jgi:protein-disulfide isomerase
MDLTPVIERVLSDPGSPAVGATSPTVTIVIFTDYQCPICRETDPALERLLADDPTVRVIFKDWPIFGALSKAAARVALAAAGQGRYLPAHSALMTARPPLDDQAIESAGRIAGLDWSRAVGTLTRDGVELERQLARHATQAWSLGLEGTPAYLVGPYLIEGGLGDLALDLAVRRARWSGPIR